MKVIYCCFLIFFLLGCTQTLHFEQQDEKSLDTAEQNMKEMELDECINLPYMPISLDEKKSTNLDDNKLNLFCEKYNQTKEQAFYFFQEHPKYLTSKNKEEQLMMEFKNVLAQPENKKLTIYQSLTAAHEKLQQP